MQRALPFGLKQDSLPATRISNRPASRIVRGEVYSSSDGILSCHFEE